MTEQEKEEIEKTKLLLRIGDIIDYLIANEKKLILPSGFTKENVSVYSAVCYNNHKVLDIFNKSELLSRSVYDGNGVFSNSYSVINIDKFSNLKTHLTEEEWFQQSTIDNVHSFEYYTEMYKMLTEYKMIRNGGLFFWYTKNVSILLLQELLVNMEEQKENLC